MRLRTLALPAIAVFVLIVDQASKAWVIENIPLNGTLDLIPLLSQWFVLTHITNSGAAFGMFPQLGLVFTFVALAVSFVIVLYHRSLPPGQWLVRFSLGLQLGGAVGNLVDRLHYGSVIDMFYLRLWPVFNVADMAIVGGVGLLMLHLLRNPETGTQPAVAPIDPPDKVDPSKGE
jgi:signal peptidase II